MLWVAADRVTRWSRRRLPQRCFQARGESIPRPLIRFLYGIRLFRIAVEGNRLRRFPLAVSLFCGASDFESVGRGGRRRACLARVAHAILAILLPLGGELRLKQQHSLFFGSQRIVLPDHPFPFFEAQNQMCGSTTVVKNVVGAITDERKRRGQKGQQEKIGGSKEQVRRLTAWCRVARARLHWRPRGGV